MPRRFLDRFTGAFALGVLGALAGVADARSLDPRYISGCAPSRPVTAPDHARVIPAAAGEGTLRRLVIRLYDDATGAPVAARVGVFRADGGAVVPPDPAAAVYQATGEQSYFYAEGACTLQVPDGSYVVRAGRGFEYEPATDAVTVGADTGIEVGLHRFIDLPALGWYGGDTHLHLAHVPVHYVLDKDDAARMMRAEDLHVMNVLDEQPFFTGALDPRSDARHLLYFSKEQRNAHFSHLTVVGLREWIPDLGCDLGTLLCGRTLDRSIRDLVHQAQQPVAVVATHPFPTQDLTSLVGWPGVGVWRAMPLDLVAGAVDAMDILCYTHQAPPAGVTDYFHALNLGFRLPPSAGTDASLTTGQSYPPGGYRVYVSPAGPFTFDSWIDGLRRGRSFVSNYPLITEFRFGTVVAGDTLLHRGRRVKGWVTAECAVPFGKIELIAAGRVVRTITAPPGGTRSLRASFEIDPRGVGWVVARVTGEAGGWHLIDANGLFAQTAPVYLRPRPDDNGGGGHVSVPDVVGPAVQRFLSVLARVDSLYQGGGSFPGGGKPAYDASVAAARDYYLRVQPDPPLPFDLVAPMEISYVHGKPWSATPTPLFRWRRAVDPDPDDSVTYALFLDDEATLTNPLYVAGLADSFYALPGADALENLRTYYWKVRAFDPGGLYRDSATSAFIVDYTATGAGDTPPAGAGLSVWPNPFNPLLRVRVGIPAGWTRTRVEVFDAAGARVRRLLDTRVSGRWLDLAWDARDDGGKPVGSGVYFVRATADGGDTIVRKAVLVK